MEKSNVVEERRAGGRAAEEGEGGALTAEGVSGRYRESI